MSTPETAALEKAIEEQGAKIRAMKGNSAPKEQIKAEVDALNALKAQLAEKQPKKATSDFSRPVFEDLLKRRFFYAPSFEIYGGVAGLYDYGPVGCAVKANFISTWRSHFVLEENMLEVDCTSLTPHAVLKSSGHVDRFTDVMVKDMKTGDCHRADHLLEDVLEARIADAKTTPEQKAEFKVMLAQIDNYKKDDLAAIFKKYNVISPLGNELSEPVDFNMMFATSIGPTGLLKGFLRPETAQGIFLCFKRLYDFNLGRLPFAGAQIGKSFRNEIAPRSGLLRVREFEMAEIEHFVDPANKNHPKFKTVADLLVPLLSAKNQMAAQPAEPMTLGDAVAKGVIANETLGYFLGRIYLFMQKIGIDVKRLRFRQHMGNEMAHYACDCWDTELHTSYGWIECVGCADRSCYDLEQHSKATGVSMTASEQLPEPIIKDIVKVDADKGKVGKAFKKEAKVVFDHLAALDEPAALALKEQLAAGPVTLTLNGAAYVLTPDMVTIERTTVKEFERKFTPSVIEPSFGIGRIIYALLEHTFDIREGDEQRTYLRLPPIIAPVKCSLLPISNQDEFQPLLHRLAGALAASTVSYRLDDSSTGIGRRYARTDEIAIPFGVTVDFQSLKDDTATVRERDSMQQVRLKIDDIAPLVARLALGTEKWTDVVARYGLVAPPAEK
eukprot:m.225618 g.225618  ORF g.225618 m.225618 type:complete len:669 (-) comp16741_c0_seq1:134-2140(-)